MREALEEAVDPVDRLQAAGHHEDEVWCGLDESLVVERAHALPLDLGGDVATAERGDERVRARARAEHVVHAGLSADVEEDHAQLVVRVRGSDLRDLGDLGLDVARRAGRERLALLGHAEGVGDLLDEHSCVVHRALGLHDDDRDAGLAHLEQDIPGPEAGVGDDDRRVEVEDRLGGEVVADGSDERQVCDLGEGARGVSSDDLVPEAELVDNA